MIQKIPTDIELFNKFIIETDDRQLELRDHTVYPLNAEGEKDYLSKDKIVSKQPCWFVWGWQKDDSKMWSIVRQIHVNLYEDYLTTENEEKKQFETRINENISSIIYYDENRNLIEIVGNSDSANNIDRAIFLVKQDIFEYETPLRKISFQYEKQIEFSDSEKNLIETYINMHIQLPDIIEYLIKEINTLNDELPDLWKRIFECKVKADKATNTICLPAPVMEGSYSPVVSFYISSHEEMQVHVDDCNQYIQDLIKDVDAHIDKSYSIYKLVYDEIENENEDEDEEYNDKSNFILYNEVEEKLSKLYETDKASLELCGFDNDFEDFKEVWETETKKVKEIWEPYNKKDLVLNEMYNTLFQFLKEKFEPNQEEEENIQVTSPEASAPAINPEFDELRMETMKRFEEGVTTFFDAEDWQIILDNFYNKHDRINEALYLETALTQHPENPKLLLRKADEEADKHEYKKALDIVNKVETLETGHHPNFFLIKGNILCKLHLKEEAIPLYEKLLNAIGAGLDHYQEIAYYNLVDLYKEKKNYLECISLTKKMLEKNENNSSYIASLAAYYRLAGLLKEAEDILKAFLDENPDDSTCIEELGHIYYENKEYEKAKEQYDKSYELDKQANYNSLFHKGNILMEQKEFGEAAVCFETCILHYYLDKRFHIAAVNCYKELDMPYLVDYHINKILELDPEFTQSLSILKEQGN